MLRWALLRTFFTLGAPIAAMSTCAMAGSAPAHAQTLQEQNWCLTKGTAASVDALIDACTAVIQSGKLTSTILANAYTNCGVGYSTKNLFDHARADFDEAVKLDPSNALAYVNLGALQAEQNEFDFAVSAFDRAIALNPNIAKAYVGRGTAFIGQENYDRAIADFNKAITLDPLPGYSYEARGTAYFLKGDLDHALADFGQALEFDPENSKYYFDRGQVYDAKKDYQTAIQQYTNALDRFNTIKWPLSHQRGYFSHRGLDLLITGDVIFAITDFEAALKTDPKFAFALYGRGLAKQRNGDTKNGDADIAAALAIDPAIAQQFEPLGLAPVAAARPQG